MAELLIKAIDAAHLDPLKDARGCYKRGDVVVVMPDGHPWGTEEGLPKFVIVKIADLPVSTAMKLIEQELDANGEPVRRRKWGLFLDSIPSAVKTQLLSTGSATVTLMQVKSHIRSKLTGETV